MSLPSAADNDAIHAFVSQLFEQHPQPRHEAMMDAGQQQRRRTLADLHGELMFVSRAQRFDIQLDGAPASDRLGDCYRGLLPHLMQHQAAQQLRDLADAIECAPGPKHVGRVAATFASIGEETKVDINRATIDIERDRAIYVIALDDDAAPVAFGVAFDQARKADNGLSLPQYNSDTASGEGLASRVVYVGSSCGTADKNGKARPRTTLSRLTQHIVKAPRGTYALNLGQWATGLSGGIIVDIYNYPPETDRDIVVAVEDALSGELKPICGRRGIQR